MEEAEKILKGKYPAKAHAAKVAAYLKSKDPSADGLIYLEGQKTCMIEDNDEPVPFRQRRPFYYLSGCALPDSYLTYNTLTTHLTLFIPPIDPSSVIWSGLPLSPAAALDLYDVDAVLPTTSLSSFLASSSATNPSSCIFAIPEQVSPDVTFLAFERKEMTGLREATDECRVVKDEYEVAMIRKANAISTLAHTAVLQAATQAHNERELEATFIEKCIANGSRDQAYHSIVASGPNAATLHYQHNNQPLLHRANLLLDAGAEWNCYCADITRTFPLAGHFTPESHAIYALVLRMQTECTALLRAGTLWDDVHAHAHHVAIAGLLHLGILKGAPAELFARRTSVAFFPHGLGHYLGMDTHDTGGHPDYADPDPMFKYLRVRGRLPAGSVITVEPGIYFCRFIVEPFLEDEGQRGFIDREVLERYWEVGGVRIEDNILITEDGCENLTTAVKGVEEMCEIIKGGKA